MPKDCLKALRKELRKEYEGLIKKNKDPVDLDKANGKLVKALAASELKREKTWKKLVYCRRKVTVGERLRVIMLRFGEYGSVNPTDMTPAQIGRKVSLPRTLVSKICCRYLQNGGVLTQLFGNPRKNAGRKRTLTDK